MKKMQQGVGLMEVLVALLILAIAILGFVALQLRAVTASVEAGNNIHATNIARDLTERMRINRGGLLEYNKAIPSSAPACGTGGSVCSAEQQAQKDLFFADETAMKQGMTLVVDLCPNSAFRRLCVFVAWGDTVIAKGNIGGNDDSCLEGRTATYRPNAQCVMVESYNDQ